MEKEKSKFSKEHWSIIIKPQESVFNLHLKDIWQYRDLLVLFVKRDFVAQYKQTILGPLWNIIQPVLTTCMFLLLFGKIANIPTDGIQPVLFYLSGITIWNFFSTCLTNTSNTFVANASIFGKVYFPRLVMPLSVVLSNIIRFAIQFCLLLAAMIYYAFNGYPIEISILWLWIPLLILLIAGLGFGLGIIVSSLTTKYRDLTVLMTFIVQLLLYVTPIGYPVSYLSHGKYKWIIELNPLSGVIEVFRYILFHKGTLYLSGLWYDVIFMFITLFLGLIIFNRIERSFMDTV